MKTMSQLQDELLDLENKLKAITSYREDGKPYYIDPEIAAIFKREIAYTKRMMEELAIILKEKLELDEEKEKEKRRLDRDRLFSDAKVFYDKTLEEYMSLTFWQRAKNMFTGKKPRSLSDREILELYGEQALETIIQERIDALIQAKEAQLAEIGEKYDTSSLPYFYLTHDVTALYDNKIERTRAGYYQELEDTIKASSNRRGK